MIRIENFGKKDYSDIFQLALDKGGDIEIDSGVYIISKTLKIGSDTSIVAQKDTIIYTANNSKHSREDFLLTNKDYKNGNTNISIKGGIWEGNCLNNPRGGLFGGGYTGSMLNFFNVTNLTLRDMELKNPECYYVRMSKVSDFVVDNIYFNTEHIRPNQDGIHLGGECKNGIITNLKGSYGSPNDDFIAMNADDCLTRLQNLDILCGDIQNITIANLQSEYCHSFIRLLSVNSTISDIKASNMRGGCKAFAVNMDGARYCKPGTRLVSIFDKRYLRGCGNIRNVLIENVEVYSKKKQKALILAESNVDNMVIKDIVTSPKHTRTPLLSLGYNQPTKAVIVDKDGRQTTYHKGYYGRLKLKRDAYKSITLTKA